MSAEVERRASLDYWDTRRRLDALVPGWYREHSLATAVEVIVKTIVRWAGGPEQIAAELARIGGTVEAQEGHHG